LQRRPAIALHGGAGLARRADLPAARAALNLALNTGYGILVEGGSSLDAVTAAVVVLENSGIFNAGKGSATTRDGRIEMDASVMEGASRGAGAVGCVSRIRNPVLAARAVLERTKHVLLVGEGAERFSRRRKIEFAPARYFRGGKREHGTVGCAALDRHGNLAAATSTGGAAGKLPGRVGDSPIAGAGTYADNRSCAVSGTGLGEMFIRSALAFNVHARLRYRAESLAVATARALREIAPMKGFGGLVAVDRRGNVAMPFNTEIMYRACIDARGRRIVAVRR
jgi:isoaspartyl peptidase/L-asparaginase-like protein (Ntn-hydrolase superfamily)